MPRDFLSDDITTNKIQPRDFLSENTIPKESFKEAASKAPFRIGEDIYKGAFNFVKNIPNYYETAKSEVPGLAKTIMENPQHIGGQTLAGFKEAINSLSQSPLNLAKYGSERLHITPDLAVPILSFFGPHDQSQEIKEYGEPVYPGEKLARGIARNSINILPISKAASTLNPLNITSTSIAKNVLKTGEKNRNIYNQKYTNLWNEASQKGFDDLSKVAPSIDITALRKFSPKKAISGVEDFISNPSLEKAHLAKSDLLKIQRDIGEMTTLRSSERKQLKAVNDAIDIIQKNMFKDKKGNIDKKILDEYNTIQKGYSEELVPYKNKHIKQFKNKKITANQLVNKLSEGEFMAKRGDYHPAIGIREFLKKHGNALGWGVGGLGGMYMLRNFYDDLMGNKLSNE